MLETLTSERGNQVRAAVKRVALTQLESGGPAAVALNAIARELPAPGPGQVLVRVEATGVSFAEQQMRRGKYYDQPKFPFVPGYDLVGRVGDRRVAALT